MSYASPEILIVGGGPSGLILALSLACNNVPVRLIEKSTTERIGQRGSGISPRTFEVFESLGIVNEVVKQAIKSPNFCIFKMPGGTEIIKDFNMEKYVESTPPIPYPNLMLLGQDLLDKILRAELAKHECCQIELGAELQTLKQWDDRVEVTIIRHNPSQAASNTTKPRGTDSSPEERPAEQVVEHASYKFVVGADGAKSVVRKQLGLAFIGETMEQRMIVGDFIGDAPFFVDKWGWWRDAEDNVTAIRPTNTPGKFTFFTGGDKNVKYAEICSSDDALKESILKGTGGRTDIKIKEFVWKSPYRVNVRMTESFRKGRVFIVGDAGHVHSPAGAQGLNTGIQDSYNLGWKLALAVKSLASPALLDSYNDERIPLVAEMLDLTTELLVVGRDALSAGREEATLKRAGNLSQLGVNYRGCARIIDEGDNCGIIESNEGSKVSTSRYGGADRGSAVKAGDRAPDAPGLAKIHHTVVNAENPTTRLFQLFSPAKHTVFIFYDLIPKATFLAVLERLRKPPVLTDIVQVIVIAKPGTRSMMDIMNAIPFPDAEGWISVFEDLRGHAYDAYADPEFTASIFVVRPDGMIGARAGNDADRILEAYFNGIFL